jgi:hypothetical protein
MRFVGCVLIAAGAIGMCGCGANEGDILGNWKLKVSVSMPATISTDITFSANHILKGVLVGSWTTSGDTVTMTISSYVGLPIDAIRGLTSSPPNGESQGKNLQSMSLNVDNAAKNMYVIDRKGKASLTPSLTRS